MLWAANFETFMYPYVPAHITKPKESKKMFLVQMPPRSQSRPVASFFPVLSLRSCLSDLVAEVLSIPKNMKILAVPVFELYDNSARSVTVLLAFVSLFLLSSRLGFRLLSRRRYGPQLACLPHLLSRYNFVMVGNDGKTTQQHT